MKYRLIPLLLFMSKLWMGNLVLQAVLCSTLFASGGNAQKVLSAKEVFMAVDFHRASVIEVFKAIEAETDFRFSYEKKDLNLNVKITIKSDKQSVSNILLEVSRLAHLKFKQINNSIHVSKMSEKTMDVQSYEVEILLAIQVTGKVTSSSDNTGIPGVNILIKGTSSGTVTDIEGNYAISVPHENDTLVFSSVGFHTEEVPVNGRTLVNVMLTEDIQSLSEIVVVGYGTQRKSDLTGAVGSVKAKTLEERPAASLNQALAGRIPGVNASVNSGRPGGRANIRIRGNTSVSVSNDPLYVIDGVILNTAGLANGSTPIDFINPDDIASVEVLKDASATAIYGSRGANGVILVTTKGGSREGASINYDAYVSMGILTRKLDLLNAEEFLRVEEIAYQNAAKYDPEGTYTDPLLKRTNPLLFDAEGNPLYDTDWQEEATQNAITQNHQLSYTGGNEKDTYGVFLGYRNENGLMKESWLKRYSGRFVFDSQAKDWITFGGNLSYHMQDENQIDPLGGGGIIPMRQVLEALPIIPVKYPDGTWGSNEDYPGMEGGGSYLNIVNDREYIVKTQTLLGNVYANIKLAEGLELRTTFGTNIINQRIDYYAGRTLNYISRSSMGQASISNERHNSWQFENYLTYKKDFGGMHSFTGLLGLSWQEVDEFSATAVAYGFQDDYFKYNNLGVASNPRPPSSSNLSYALNSYFSRINYSLKDKYLFTVTGRIDGSSKFGVNNKYAFFPSVAAAWRVSEEEFIQATPLISDLKVRASYGVTGNSELPAYQSLATLRNYSYIFNGARAIGVGINRLANPALQWEKNYQFDLGIELGLFNDRISLEMDVYKKVSTDMLLEAPVPSSSGYTAVTENIGSMENRGIELMLNTLNIASNDFSWNTTFNISINKNEVKELTGGSDIISGPTIIREGEPVNSFFGYIRLGTWGTDEEDEAAQYFRLPGDIKYADVNNDGQINQEDRVVIGKGTPDGFGTLLNTLRYKNFELTLDLQFMYGNDVNYETVHSAEDRQGIANSLASVLNAWTPENQDTPIAQFRPVSAGYDTNDDSHRLKDASFIRGRNLLLAYNFPQEIINRIALSRLRVYTSVQNFFLITEYPGYDPEASTHGRQFAQGVVRYDYPKPTVFMLGLNIGF